MTPFCIRRRCSRAEVSGIYAGMPQKYILRPFWSCGIPVRWSCRVGVCHTCKTGVVAGKVSYRPDPIDAPANGKVLICCSHSAAAEALETVGLLGCSPLVRLQERRARQLFPGAPKDLQRLLVEVYHPNSAAQSDVDSAIALIKKFRMLSPAGLPGRTLNRGLGPS